MLIVAVIIKATSKGEAIYKQTRMGLNRKEFTMYKFRSMKTETVNAGEMQDAEHKMTEKSDPRVTKIGAFIRKSGIDELPQLYNVIKGEMSLVGPRPELPYHVGHFKDEIPFYMVKHYVKPGISGWAQVNGLRGNTSIEERIKYDIYYIENWSLWFDIKILFLTLFKGIFSENAY
jgi:lipopolysaccharide/colanic/teichoic acid biosynthesis glycosyltransferase